MLHCGACGKFLAATGAAFCGVCPLKYHKACLALPDKANISKDWACPSCKRNTRRGDNSQTPVKGISASPPRSEESIQPSHRDSVEEAESREARRDRELAQFMAEMREFRNEMLLLRDSVSSRLDTLEQRLDVLEQREAGAAGAGTAELERTIAELKQELNDRDQEALLSDLEIGQLPEERGVSVTQTVTVLAARLGVTLEPRDVVFAERVGAPPAEASGRPRRVVVRLACRQLREDLLKAARVRRNVVAPAPAPAPAPVDGDGDAAPAPAPVDHRVYLNERLTRRNRQLLYQVRGECKMRQWRYSWTKRGRIFVRQADGSPVYQIRSESDVERVLGTQPQK